MPLCVDSIVHASEFLWQLGLQMTGDAEQRLAPFDSPWLAVDRVLFGFVGGGESAKNAVSFAMRAVIDELRLYAGSFPP